MESRTDAINFWDRLNPFSQKEEQIEQYACSYQQSINGHHRFISDVTDLDHIYCTDQSGTGRKVGQDSMKKQGKLTERTIPVSNRSWWLALGNIGDLASLRFAAPAIRYWPRR